MKQTKCQRASARLRQQIEEQTESGGISPENAALLAGLRYTSDRDPGLRRLGTSPHFRYENAEGQAIADDRTLARIESLAIPPAWTDVWISSKANGHLQATGRDAKGRKQYRYHDCWREVRDENKYARLAEFARALPRIRAQVATDLRKQGLPREKVLATIVRLLETTSVRIGNETYAQENDSFGLTTLRNRHFRDGLSGPVLSFTGKSGKTHRVAVDDPRLARIVKRIRDLPGQRLFQYEHGDGQVAAIDSDDVNAYLKTISGEEFTAKDFRTWAGTLVAAAALEKAEAPESEQEANRIIVAAIDRAAASLGNTRAVCRTAYVHPAILEAYRDGSLQEWSRKSQRWTDGDEHDLDRLERLVLRVIEADE